MYKVTFNVDTDGDFIYKDMNIVSEYVNTIEKAMDRMIYRLELLRDTIEAKFDTKVQKEIIQERIDWAIECKEKDWDENYYIDFSWSNYEGEFYFTKVDMIQENDFIRFIEIK